MIAIDRWKQSCCVYWYCFVHSRKPCRIFYFYFYRRLPLKPFPNIFHWPLGFIFFNKYLVLELILFYDCPCCITVRKYHKVILFLQVCSLLCIFFVLNYIIHQQHPEGICNASHSNKNITLLPLCEVIYQTLTTVTFSNTKDAAVVADAADDDADAGAARISLGSVWSLYQYAWRCQNT
jgi:hypothetical protein